VKPWQIILLCFGVVVLFCCGGGALLGYRAFSGAKNADAEADHFADEFLAKVAVKWDVRGFQDDLAPEWKDQSQEIQDAYMHLFRTRLGALKSAAPFSATQTNYSTYNGQRVTSVTVRSQATFEKAPGTVRMKLERRDGKWLVVGIKIDSDALLDQDKATEPPKKSGE
jgi:hypothetical protein